MSDRHVVGALFALGAWAGALPAQTDPALLARRDALRARADSLTSRLASLDAIARDSALTVTMRVGVFAVRTTPALQEIARAAFTQADAEARRALGTFADSLGGHLTLTLREQHRAWRASWTPLVGVRRVAEKDHIVSVSLEATLDGRDVPGVLVDYPLARGELATNTLAVVERAVGFNLAAPIEPWLNHRLPLRAASDGWSASLYRTLATSDAAVVRHCVAGDSVACRVGFALDSLPRDRVSAWYDASDLPTLARTAGDPMQRGWMLQAISNDLQEACVGQRQVEACRQMLARLPDEAFRIPMPGAARESLARMALEIGGAGAVSRLRQGGAPSIGAQLAAAAGVSTDELLRRWMARVAAARPASPLPNASFVLASLACIAVCYGWAAKGKPWN